MANSADRKRFKEIEKQLAANRPPGPPYKEVYGEIRDAIWALKDQLVEKYRDRYGRDWRPQVSHLLEQAGTGLLSDIEKERKALRDGVKDKRIAEDRARGKKNDSR